MRPFLDSCVCIGDHFCECNVVIFNPAWEQLNMFTITEYLIHCDFVCQSVLRLNV
jgi:hypothetical protein